ncbi:radical SAM protein [Kineosporia sp. R_H_3]|uniref:radical SAM protein n=1 Tax=Kineosporia sp. R_H_3 TaxID=1961848 RepID=UPI000B4C04F1|nr:radical SAM protein [Kineosporia sp. R_H_3]
MSRSPASAPSLGDGPTMVAASPAEASVGTQALIAGHERSQLVRKLRVSLTSHCNLSCFFCHNEGQGELKRAAVGLSPSDYGRIGRAAVAAGVGELKLTGGEPTLFRRDDATILDVVRSLSEARQKVQPLGISMTTNGVTLEKMAERLADAGLDRVTVSLPSLRDDMFKSVARVTTSRSLPSVVLRGLDAARQAGLTPLKVNTVLMGRPGSGGWSNVHEVAHIARVLREACVSEWRLYTLLDHDGFADHDRWYRYWTDGLLHEVLAQLGVANAHEVESLFDRVSDTSQRSAYPKLALELDVDGLRVVIEALESGRPVSSSFSDEGPYALRLSASGQLTGVLGGQSGSVDLMPLLKTHHAAGDRALASAFRTAQEYLMPDALGVGI